MNGAPQTPMIARPCTNVGSASRSRSAPTRSRTRCRPRAPGWRRGRSPHRAPRPGRRRRAHLHRWLPPPLGIDRGDRLLQEAHAGLGDVAVREADGLGVVRPNITSSFAYPKTNASFLSIRVTSISSPSASDNMVELEAPKTRSEDDNPGFHVPIVWVWREPSARSMPAASMLIKASQVATGDASISCHGPERHHRSNADHVLRGAEWTDALQPSRSERRRRAASPARVQQAAAHDRQREAERSRREARSAGCENRSRSSRSSRSRAANPGGFEGPARDSSRAGPSCRMARSAARELEAGDPGLPRRRRARRGQRRRRQRQRQPLTW